MQDVEKTKIEVMVMKIHEHARGFQPRRSHPSDVGFI
jgi:hypothetical protein